METNCPNPLGIFECKGLKKPDEKMCMVCNNLTKPCTYPLCEDGIEHIVNSCPHRCKIDKLHLCRIVASAIKTGLTCDHNHGCPNRICYDSGPKGDTVLCSSCMTICPIKECKRDHAICKHCCIVDDCSGRKANGTEYCPVHLCSMCKRPHVSEPVLFETFINHVVRTERSPFWRPYDGGAMEPENVMCLSCILRNPPLVGEDSDEDRFGEGLELF
jgi:hypothetical protein